MKTWHWLIVSVVIVIVVIGVVFFVPNPSPHSFFSGGKYRIVGQINQYEVFRDLLIIILTLAGLTIALFGLGVYLLLRGRIEGIARKEAKKKSAEAQAKVTHRLVLEIVKIAIKPARERWRTGQALQEDKKAKRESLENWSIDSLKDALKFAEDTLPVVQNKDFWENVENKEYLLRLKNNLAYYMAWRKETGDRKDARLYAREIEKEAHSQTIPNYEHLDTAAWVFRRFALDDKDRKESEALVLELTDREDIPEEVKKTLLDKYTEKSKDS